MSTPPAGWYPDPASDASIRYWDGAVWTDRVQPRDVPPPPAPPAVPAPPRAAPPAAVGSGYPQQPAPPAPAAGPQLIDPYGGYAPAPAVAAPVGRIGPDGQPLAGWWRRAGGYLLDGIIVGIPTVIAAIIASTVIVAGGGTLVYEDRLQEINDALLSGDTSLSPFDVFDVFAPGFWTVAIVAGVVYLLVSLVNGVLLISRTGQTLGDRAVNVRKVVAGRSVPTFGTALARWLIPNVLFAMIGNLVPLGFLLAYGNYLWPVLDRRGQTLHDKMVRTFVERADLAGPPQPRR